MSVLKRVILLVVIIGCTPQKTNPNNEERSIVTTTPEPQNNNSETLSDLQGEWYNTDENSIWLIQGKNLIWGEFQHPIKLIDKGLILQGKEYKIKSNNNDSLVLLIRNRELTLVRVQQK